MVVSLHVTDLSVGAPGSPPLLRGVSFSLAQGERVGLVGASGCGKSLTAAALCGLLRPPLAITKGEIEIEGQRLARASATAWRRARGRQVFQIFQSPGTALTPARRIALHLAEAAQIAGVSAQTAVPQALDAVALARDVGDLFPYQLSGGMKQRVLIAMALILSPRILIADEPTTGLDVLTERDILAALNTAAQETGASVLFISHDLRAVAAVASRTLVMEAGAIVEDGPIAALGRSPAASARALADAAEALQSPC